MGVVNSIISDELLDIWPDGTDTSAIENGYFFDFVKVQLIVCLVPVLFQIGTSTKFPQTRKEHADLSAREATDTMSEANGGDGIGKAEQRCKGDADIMGKLWEEEKKQSLSLAKSYSTVCWKPKTW